MPDRSPSATYRLQLGPGFGFADASELVDYIADLGVSHVYLSPVLQARAGSEHGYDVADPGTVSQDLGGEEGLRALAATAASRDMGLVVDVVPNHVGTGPDNPLWEDLLAEGPAGDAARIFDVDWHPPLPGAEGKVILPVLGAPYGAVLHAGELEVTEHDGRPRLRYYEQSFPLSAESVEAIARMGGVGALRGTPGEPQSWNRLHGLLERQHYRLVYWRSGGALINYRRFFTIDELAGVRVEDEAVFDLTHERILALVDDGVVDGLRIDHPDGLRDPTRYLERLAQRTGGVWTVAEKILGPAERLPDWPVAGTTGYEFANDVVHLFVDAEAEPQLVALERDLGMGGDDFATVAARAKHEILDAELAADLDRLARLLWAETQEHREVRDVSFDACCRTLREAIVALDVYRTYVDPLTGEERPEDQARIDAAVSQASRASGTLHFLCSFLADVLAGRCERSATQLEIVARFQQLSGAVMAKGVEDTAFYRHRRLLALNEVGGHPGEVGVTVAAFHERNAERARRTPVGMLTTATHDTKRGEDVRLRIAALSEFGRRWTDAVRSWHERNAGAVTDAPGGPAPDPSTELLVYQTLVGVWPVDGSGPSAQLRDRVVAYAVKASREAKERTSWIDVDEGFEAGVAAFCEQILDPSASSDFLASLAAVAAEAAEIAMVSGLAQVLLRCTSPGVPDTYQGSELWDDSLVDPDNRRPVDYELRRRLLRELDTADPDELWEHRRDGRVKLWVLTRALRLRHALRECFAPDSGYLPLRATGEWADHILGWARTTPDGVPRVVAVALRLPGAIMRGSPLELGGVFDRTTLELPDGEWDEILHGHRGYGGGSLPLADALADLPVALLVPGGSRRRLCCIRGRLFTAAEGRRLQ